MKVIIVNGYPESGKTTFEDLVIKICKERGIKAVRISLIDPVKHIVSYINAGYINKDLKTRKFLSDLKDLTDKYCGFSIKETDRRLKEFETCGCQIVFIDCREAADINYFKEKYKALTLFVKRHDKKPETNNHADANVEDYKYDYIIDNTGDLQHLGNIVFEFLDKFYFSKLYNIYSLFSKNESKKIDDWFINHIKEKGGNDGKNKMPEHWVKVTYFSPPRSGKIYRGVECRCGECYYLEDED